VDIPYNGHGFLLENGSYTTLDVPGQPPSGGASGINASGQIVGSSRGHGFLFDHGSYSTLDVPGAPGATDAPDTNPSGINASGQIAGSYTDVNGTHGFLLDNGSYSSFRSYTFFNGINDSGQIVG
jgi:uncharacterized membrane protein